MKKKVIYSGFDTRHAEVIETLSVNHGWEPVFFNSTEITRSWSGENYPNAVFQDEAAIRQGRFDYSRLGTPVPVDADITRTLSIYEPICYLQMEDSTGWNFSFEERSQYYHDLLKYWNTLIHRLKPDLLVAFNWPHTVTAYTLYLLCKHYYSIDVLFLDPMPLLNKNLHVVGCALEDLALPFRKIYTSDKPLTQGLNVVEYLSDRRSPTWTYSSQNLEDVTRWQKQSGFQFKEFFRILYYVIKGKAFQESHVGIKKNRQPFQSSKSKLNHFEYFWYRNRIRRNDLALRKLYTTFCIQPDLKKKYLYFAASLQPEAPSDIGGGFYSNLIMALELLSACIPLDWVIYYKEHPGIFYPLTKGSTRRNKMYYERIKALKNVQMITTDTDSYELIDHAKAVACVSGTSSWEAIVRGKPGLLFGNVWYQACRSVFRIETMKDCKIAIDKIVRGAVPEEKDIDRYLAAVEHVAKEGLIDLNYPENFKKCLDSEATAQIIARALLEAWELYYKKDQ